MFLARLPSRGRRGRYGWVGRGAWRWLWGLAVASVKVEALAVEVDHDIGVRQMLPSITASIANPLLACRDFQRCHLTILIRQNLVPAVHHAAVGEVRVVVNAGLAAFLGQVLRRADVLL